MKKNLVFLILLGVTAFFLPNIVLAQTITGLVANVVRVIWIVATAIVIIFWIVTGVLFLSSQGDPGKLTTAKHSLFAAIAGTILVILAYSAGVIIENAILFGR
ncbi:MAG: hypothetical protein HY005_03340 [Candidatus Staskawiczbacteria bacterium]|nr:hypothetical protein [Candidatus Staskawiczbacteria bacterium]MBI3337623.1 hypothetical protein [Candidatus Staskawiczbacteria bacterium]